MSVNWQNKILDFDIPPPPDVWNKIADQLDEEFKNSDIMLSQKLYDYEINPPSFIFENVLTGISSKQEIKPTAKAMVFSVRRISFAAVTIGLLALTLLYLLNERTSSANRNAGLTTMHVIPGVSAISPPNTDNIKVTPNESDFLNTVVSPTAVVPNKKVDSYSRRARIDRTIKHAGLNPLLAVNTIPSISVSAPPIYDGNGNIIMDESLVSAPDENYIIVTSPNGEQTKISRKFLKMLTVLNGGTSTSYTNPESFQWKMRFEEWRSKLLQQASYIPTANNFLDIMDLKELLQEN